MDELTRLQLEQLAQQLESSGLFRVLRRLEPRQTIPVPEGSVVKTAIFLDVETTGLNSSSDEIIELAMVPFRYGLDGVIYEVGEPFQRFRQPTGPIPSFISDLTGITDDMVLGQTIDPTEVVDFANEASLVIAHNAFFDRPFVEKLVPDFSRKPWACSMSQIDWNLEGFEGTKLSYLVASIGIFYDRHRAVNDCLAAIELLSRKLPKSGVPAMASLLVRARQSCWRIWAENAPYSFKDILKLRGYRWNGDGSRHPRAWYIDVEESLRDTEIQFLEAEIYRGGAHPLVRRIDAFNRFSDRL